MTGHRTPIDPAKLLDLVREGYSNAQLADHFGCTVRTIDRRRHDDPDLTLAIITARGEIAAANARQHGTARRYARGCRCRPCTDANTLRCRTERLVARERHGYAAPNQRLGRPRTVFAVSPVRPVPVKVTDPETLIAQAIARGEPTSRIMQSLAVDYETVAAVREALTEAVAS